MYKGQSVGRPPKCKGDEVAWSDWSFQVRAYLDMMTVTMSSNLDAVEADLTAPLALAALGDVAAENARKIFYVLTMLLSGAPLLLLKRVERGNGLECWRLLCERYEGVTASRLHSMLASVMRPKQFRMESQLIECDLQEWEFNVQKWEQMANDILNDAVKRQRSFSRCLHRTFECS